MPDMVHPVTGAHAAVSKKDQARYEDNGWQDATPYEFKDNSAPAPLPPAEGEES